MCDKTPRLFRSFRRSGLFVEHLVIVGCGLFLSPLVLKIRLLIRRIFGEVNRCRSAGELTEQHIEQEHERSYRVRAIVHALNKIQIAEYRPRDAVVPDTEDVPRPCWSQIEAVRFDLTLDLIGGRVDDIPRARAEELGEVFLEHIAVCCFVRALDVDLRFERELIGQFRDRDALLADIDVIVIQLDLEGLLEPDSELLGQPIRYSLADLVLEGIALDPLHEQLAGDHLEGVDGQIFERGHDRAVEVGFSRLKILRGIILEHEDHIIAGYVVRHLLDIGEARAEILLHAFSGEISRHVIPGCAERLHDLQIAVIETFTACITGVPLTDAEYKNVL